VNIKKIAKALDVSLSALMKAVERHLSEDRR
jgi:hypothetical protein